MKWISPIWQTVIWTITFHLDKICNELCQSISAFKSTDRVTVVLQLRQVNIFAIINEKSQDAEHFRKLIGNS